MRCVKFYALVIITTLAACSSQESDLQAYFRDVKNKPAGYIEELPEGKVYEPFEYSAMNLRSPFEKPQDVVSIEVEYTPDVKPDLERVKQPLESYSIDHLGMVGHLSQEGVMWALIQDPTGRIHRVTFDDFIGENHGKVTELDNSYIGFVELVPAGQGRWRERPRSIKLNATEQ